MPVSLRKMTKEEYKAFYRWSVEHQAEELMEECRLSREEAMEETKAELTRMLPHGLNTVEHDLMTILEEDTGEKLGFIWTLREETERGKQSFLCDFAIWEARRRKGYGTAALALAEKQAGKAGCRESVLFVAEGNTGAMALYQKAGYRILRQEAYGYYMIKQL